MGIVSLVLGWSIANVLRVGVETGPGHLDEATSTTPTP
jgi:hypothetical protein